jgi:hypothetical protein
VDQFESVADSVNPFQEHLIGICKFFSNYNLGSGFRHALDGSSHCKFLGWIEKRVRGRCPPLARGAVVCLAVRKTSLRFSTLGIGH